MWQATKQREKNDGWQRPEEDKKQMTRRRSVSEKGRRAREEEQTEAQAKQR
jgi:hypothetical protein